MFFSNETTDVYKTQFKMENAVVEETWFSYIVSLMWQNNLYHFIYSDCNVCALTLCDEIEKNK